MRRATKLWIPPKPAIIRCAADVRRANFLPGWTPGAAGAGGGAEATFPVVEATNTGKDESASTSHSVSLPAGIQAGDLLIVIMYDDGGNTFSSSGWTSFFSQVGPSNRSSIYGFYRFATGSEGSSVNFTSTSNTFSMHLSYRISGASSPPEAATTSGSGSNQEPNPPSLSPSWGSAKTLWLAIGGTNHSNGTAETPSTPSGYSGLIHIFDEVGFFDLVDQAMGAWAQIEAASENPGVFDFPNMFLFWVAATIAIEPA